MRSFQDVERTFGGLDGPGETALALYQFFLNGGEEAFVVRTRRGAVGLTGNAAARTGMHALLDLDPYAFNLLCIPDAAHLDAEGRKHTYAAAARLCELQRAFFVCELPAAAANPSDAVLWMASQENPLTPNGATYFPRVRVDLPGKVKRTREAGPGGTVSGIIARVDAAKGVWKAPAGNEATLVNAVPVIELADSHARALNPRGINPIRILPTAGAVLWGARTLRGDDVLGDEYKYVSVRRLVLHVERSIHRGLSWAVFQRNDDVLWQAVRADVEDFLLRLWKEGALQGTKPDQAFYVKVGFGETMTQSDLDAGHLIVRVGIAPLKPAEFVVVRIDLQARERSSSFA